MKLRRYRCKACGVDSLAPGASPRCLVCNGVRAEPRRERLVTWTDVVFWFVLLWGVCLVLWFD